MWNCVRDEDPGWADEGSPETIGSCKADSVSLPSMSYSR
jgi:hypothetical protein